MAIGVPRVRCTAVGEFRGRPWRPAARNLVPNFVPNCPNLGDALYEAIGSSVPFYQRYADLNPGLRAFGAPAILLVWLYVMANVIVFGAELNWWRSRRREQRLVEELPGLA